MPRDLPEGDWKTCRKLQAVALERFCERVLGEIGAISSNTAASHHTRYLDVYKLIERRDDDIARAFNDPRRSNIIFKMAAVVALDLLTPDELQQLTPATREAIESLLAPVGRSRGPGPA